MEQVTNEDLGSRVGIIETRLNTLITTVDRYIVSAESRHNALEAKVNERGQFRLPVFIASVVAFVTILGFLVSLLAIGFTLIKNQNDLTVALAVAPIAADSRVSVTDRADIRSSLSKNSDRISAIESAQVRQTERSTEVETQIHDLHTIGNLDRSYQMAFIGSLWRSEFKQNLMYNGMETQPRILPR